MPEDNDYCVAAILRHLYSLPYLPPAEYSAAYHVHVYASADKYGCLELKSSAREAFKDKLNPRQTQWSAELQKLASLIDLVYTTTVDLGLHDLIIDLPLDLDFGSIILADGSAQQQLTQIFQQTPDFAFDIWVANARARQAGRPVTKKAP